MNRSRRFVLGTLSAAAVLGLAFATTALARGPGHHGCDSKRGHGFERALEALELDAETRAAVDRTLDARRESRRALRSEIRDARRELGALLEQDLPDTETVLARAEALGALKTEERKERLRSQLEVQALLEPAERAGLRERLHARRTFEKPAFDR